MKNNFTELYKDIIVPIIVKYLPDAKIILYGSRARGDAREGSDIDVALDMGHAIDTLIMSNIIGDLEESQLPICFDIVDFRKISEDMQNRIFKDGIVWKK
jgi:predicted nucleotidyltransferase